MRTPGAAGGISRMLCAAARAAGIDSSVRRETTRQSYANEPAESCIIFMGKTIMSSPTPPNIPPQGQVPAAKKTSIWVWIFGGLAVFLFAIMLTCGVVAYMGMRMIKSAGFDSELMRTNPGLAMAKMVTAMNKDYETVSTDDRKGIIVVREKSTGKVMTMKFDPATKQMVVTTDDGKQ